MRRLTGPLRRALAWLRHYRLTAALIVGVLAIAVGVYSNASTSRRACSAALSVRDATTDVIADAKRRTEQTPAATPREREQAVDFYSHAIRRLQRVNCPT